MTEPPGTVHVAVGGLPVNVDGAQVVPEGELNAHVTWPVGCVAAPGPVTVAEKVNGSVATADPAMTTTVGAGCSTLIDPDPLAGPYAGSP